MYNMKDMFNAPGSDKAPMTKQLQWSLPSYCTKTGQVVQWPHHEQDCAPKKSCEMTSNMHKCILSYNIVKEYYQDLQWKNILMKETEIMDNMDFENQMVAEGSVDSYMYRTRMYIIMGEAHRRRGIPSVALEYFEKSRKVTDLADYPSNPIGQKLKDVAYSNLAALLKDNGDFDKSNMLYKTIKEMRENATKK